MQRVNQHKRRNRKKSRKRRQSGKQRSVFQLLGDGFLAVIGLILSIPRSAAFKAFLVAVLIVFIASVYSSKNAKDVPMSDIRDQLQSQTGIEKMEKCNARQLLQNLNINSSDYGSFLYYKSKNNMNSDELLILKAGTSGSLDDAEDAVESYAASRAKTFGQYAPKQAAKQKNAIILQRGEYLFYCAASNPEKYEEVFNNAV